MIFQLHWQNLKNLDETEFVAQVSDEEVPDVLEHFYSVLQKTLSTPPEGWGSMICTEDSKYFMKAVRENHE